MVCAPSATPRRAKGNVSAISAEAGAWYEPLAIPMARSPTRSQRYEPDSPIAMLVSAIRKRPPTMTRRAPSRSASTPSGALLRPEAMVYAVTAKPICVLLIANVSRMNGTSAEKRLFVT